MGTNKPTTLYENETDKTNENVTYSNLDPSRPDVGSEDDMQTLERKILEEVQCLNAAVQTRLHDAIFTAMEPWKNS